MQDDKMPKAFISYSWSSDRLVLELAQRLISHGVDVVLDKWELKEGQDKYAFMERCVNDPDITKVLIICDRVYAQKANNRTGGVGDETVIISGEIYGKMKQEKFIPIIAERDDEGNEYLPAYIKTRIYIDLSDTIKYEEQYEKLLRNIYEKPQLVKPKLGKRPEWLDEEKTNFFPLKDLIRQIHGSNILNKRRNCISRFQEAYIDALKDYYKCEMNPKEVYDTFLNMKPIRDIYLDFVETVAEMEDNYAEVLAENLEYMYNKLCCIRTFNENANSVCENDLDIYKTLLWELFICIIVYMRHIKDYAAINVLLTYTYFLETSLFGGVIKQANYTAFQHYSSAIEEHYKQRSDMKNKYTLMGDIICNQREKLPIYTSEAIAEADLFLYQVCNAYELVEDEKSWYGISWFPTCYIYVQNKQLEWERMKSRRYCKKMQILFGVESIDELKKRIGKCVYDSKMRYPNSWEAAPAILNYIKVDDIGSLN